MLNNSSPILYLGSFFIKIYIHLMYKDGSDGGTVKMISYNSILHEYDYYLIPDESFLIDGQNLSVDKRNVSAYNQLLSGKNFTGVLFQWQQKPVRIA